jgi:hypothetical protein
MLRIAERSIELGSTIIQSLFTISKYAKTINISMYQVCVTQRDSDRGSL